MIWLLFSCLSSQKISPVSTPSFTQPLPEQPIPKVLKTKPYTPPTISKHKTIEGSTIVLRENTKLPLINLSIVLPGGYTDDQKSWGRADIAASMMLKSNQKYNMIEQSQELREQGARVDIEVYEQHTAIDVIVHKQTLQKTLSLISEMILSPLYSQDEWDSLIEYQRTEIEQSQEDTSSLLSSIQNMILYPKDHPLHRLAKGSATSIQNLTIKETKEWHINRINPKHIGFLAVGDIDIESLTGIIENTFQQWPQTTWTPPHLSWNAGHQTGMFLIDIPDEQQSALRVLIPSWTEEIHPKELKRKALGIAMGGSFTSRLNNVLREEKGYTYGAYCSFYESPTGTVFQARTSVRRDATAPALHDLLATLSSAQEGFSTEEWQKSTNTMRNNIISQFQSRQSTLSSMKQKWRNKKDINIAQKRLLEISQFGSTPPSDEAQLFNYEHGLVILAGDISKVKETLTPWSFTVVDLTTILDGKK